MTEMEDQTRESLEMLVTVSRLLSSKLELSELLTYIMELSSRVVGSERASLFLLDEKTGELYFDVALGLDPELQTIRLKLGEGIAGMCAKEARSIIINDVAQDTRHSQKVDKQSGFVTRSVLACPMIIKGHVIGVVQAINHIEGPFTERDQRNFEAFASQAAVAIENARLFSSVKEEKRRLQTVFTNTKEGTVLTDAEGRVLLMNESAQIYLNPEKTAFQNIREGFAGMLLKPELEKIITSRENVVPFELVRESPKKLILEGSAIKLISRVNDKDVTEGWLWLFRDVTDERIEANMARSFLSLISHKLKTPLTSITGYSQMLDEEVKEGKLVGFLAKAVDTINKQGLKLRDLVERLLNYITIEELEPTKLHSTVFLAGQPFKVAAEQVKQQYPQAPVEIKETGLEGIKLCGDEFLVKEIFRNLMDNAIKFNTSPRKEVSISAVVKDGKAEISFKDNGVGIPPEELSKIFNKFYQVESSFTGQVEGWGLGLAFVKSVVEVHGGSVDVKSQIQNGSVFTVTLPSSDKECAEEAKPEQSQTPRKAV